MQEKKPTVRMFVDENGHFNLREDLNQPGNRFLCLTGVIMRLSTHDILTKQLNELKGKYFSRTDIVLHRREIISAKEPFEALKDDITRASFNDDLLKIMSELQYGVLTVVIDKKRLVDRYGLYQAKDPYALGLEFLMQRYQYWMQDYEKRGRPITGDILAEARGGAEDKITKLTYQLIYSGKGYNKLNDAEKYYTSKEIKLKKKKENIAGLQFVDLISHPARRYMLSLYGQADNLKKTSFEESVVDILVKKKFRRHNQTIDGIGAVFFPK